MAVELVELAESWTLSERERVACDALVEALVTALRRRLPHSLELLYLDIGITRRLTVDPAATQERHH